MSVRISAGSVFALLLAAQPLAARPVDGIFLEAGHSHASSSDLTLTRVSVQKEIKAIRAGAGAWQMRGYLDLGVGYWNNSSVDRTNSGIADIGLTPIFRFEYEDCSFGSPYLEAGVGAHFLSHTSVSEFRQFGSAFQFGDHLGVGIRFGPAGCWDISYRLQHLSNAGIKDPNRGINYNLVRMGYCFR